MRLSEKPSAQLFLSIGAVKFGGGQIVDEFYTRIDPQSSEKAGFVMDASTVMWWLKQGEDARGELSLPGVDVRTALLAFAEWCGDDPKPQVWGNGATFNNVILASAFRLTGIPQPWRYSANRCYRTVSTLNPQIPMQRVGTKHNALDDARSQALHLMQLLASSTRGH